MARRLSLVIAVYNKTEYLRFVLGALHRQTFKDFEVLIADDGSDSSVAKVVNEAKRTYSFPIKHLWHADKGWRKNVMLNYAINESQTEYIIFIDGDCIPSERFIEDHYLQREEGSVLLGRRVEHSKRWANQITIEKIENGDYERYTFRDIVDAIFAKSARLEHGIRVTSPFLRSWVEKSDNILGCNFSTYKKHLEDVNGFDEDYYGPGCGEDSDIFFRLNLIGITGKSLRNLAIQYHLWHPSTEVSEENKRRFESVRQQNNAHCKNGLKKL